MGRQSQPNFVQADSAKLAVHMAHSLPNDCGEGYAWKDALCPAVASLNHNEQLCCGAASSSCSSVLVTAITCMTQACYASLSDKPRQWTPGQTWQRGLQGIDRPSIDSLHIALDTAVELLKAELPLMPDLHRAFGYLHHSVSALLSSPPERLGQKLLEFAVACDSVLQNTQVYLDINRCHGVLSMQFFFVLKTSAATTESWYLGVQELEGRLKHSNDQGLDHNNRNAADPGSGCDRLAHPQTVSMLTAIAQSKFWTNQENLHLVQKSPALASHMLGQLAPDVRSLCVTALSTLGISEERIRNTATAQMLVSEALGEVAATHLRLICAACNSQLLQRTGAAMERDTAMSTVPALMAVQSAAGIDADHVACPGQVTRHVVADTLKLIMQLSNMREVSSEHQPLIWMAVASNITMLKQLIHSPRRQNILSLGPAVVKHVICKAFCEVQSWIEQVARQCSQETRGGLWSITQLDWEQLLPPLGPIQVHVSRPIVVQVPHMVLATVQIHGSHAQSCVQVLNLLLSTAYCQWSAGAMSSCHHQDWAEAVKSTVCLANMCRSSGGDHMTDWAMLSIIDHLHARIEFVRNASCRQLELQLPMQQGCVVSSISASRAMCIAESLILDLMCYLVRTGLPSKVTIEEAKAWTTKVLSTPGENDRTEVSHFTCGRTTSCGDALDSWLSGIHWLTGVCCLLECH